MKDDVLEGRCLSREQALHFTEDEKSWKIEPFSRVSYRSLWCLPWDSGERESIASPPWWKDHGQRFLHAGMDTGRCIPLCLTIASLGPHIFTDPLCRFTATESPKKKDGLFGIASSSCKPTSCNCSTIGDIMTFSYVMHQSSCPTAAELLS